MRIVLKNLDLIVFFFSFTFISKQYVTHDQIKNNKIRVINKILNCHCVHFFFALLQLYIMNLNWFNKLPGVNETKAVETNLNSK